MELTPPFELLNYFYTSSFVSANSEFSSEKYKQPKLLIVSKLFQTKEEPKLWKIGLFIGTADKIDPESFPYDFSISIMGEFCCYFPEDFSDEEILNCKKLLYVNGSSILYSSARDHILTLTASGPYEPFIIPTHRFNPEDLQEELLKK